MHIVSENVSRGSQRSKVAYTPASQVRVQTPVRIVPPIKLYVTL